MFSSCTKDFEEANVNPYEITDKDLEQDFNNVGSYFSSLLANLFGHQIEENLVAESFCNHMAQPSVFVSGVNNTTYYITWNTYWDRIYDNLMSPSGQVMDLAKAGDYDVFYMWAKLIRILGVSRLTTYHGPVIYSTYGQDNVGYDSEEDLYNAFFADLDSIQDVFSANEDYAGMGNFDASYDGDVTKWEKLVNSMRLRLAIRLSDIHPDLAQEQGEMAIADDAGLITSSDDDFYISLYGSEIYIGMISLSWNDSRMSAAMESFLVGLKDPRISSMFAPVDDESLVTDHPDYPYKGVRCGGENIAKSDHTVYSTINTDIDDWEDRPYLTSSEVYFNLAEAALRGWDGAGDAATNYEAGITASFNQWGASGVSDYLADATSTPIDYNDIVYDDEGDGTINDFESLSSVTVAWDESVSNEEKLEKIITQKWIAAYTNPNEPWVDFRRTGYPKLPHVYHNYSSSDWGVIPEDEWIKRMPFVPDERTSNADAIEEVVTTMNGADLISTRLWWDTEDKDETNF